MDILARFLLIALVGYVLGSIPAGYLVGRLAGGIDIREEGEGNVGARNAFHEVGAGWGIAVFLVDFGKGASAALLFGNGPLWEIAVAGALLVVGHAYPVWLHFVGGKGLAAAGGFTAAMMPWAGLAGGVGALVVWLLTRRFLPTLVTLLVVSFLFGPFTGVDLPVVGVLLGLFLLVSVKRLADEPRMRRVEAATGWDRRMGGSR